MPSMVSEAQLQLQHKGESHASKRRVRMTVVSRTVAPPWGRESQGQRGVQNASIWMAAYYTALPRAYDSSQEQERTCF